MPIDPSIPVKLLLGVQIIGHERLQTEYKDNCRYITGSTKHVGIKLRELERSAPEQKLKLIAGGSARGLRQTSEPAKSQNTSVYGD